MSATMNHEELVELLQEGKIGYLRFVLEGENGQDYLEWWRAHRTHHDLLNAPCDLLHKDKKHNDPAIIIHRYKAEVDSNTEVLITLKETTIGKYKGNKIYTLELEGLENVGK